MPLTFSTVKFGISVFEMKGAISFSSPNCFINVLVIYMIRIARLAVFLLVGDNSVIKLLMLCINGVALICFCAYYCKFPSTSSSIFIDFVLYNKVH